MPAALDRNRIEKAYDRWAPVYDKVFGKVFERGRMAAIKATETHIGAHGGRILEVGVGTGISLLSYSRKNRLVGVDISAGMLRKARKRVIEHHLTNVEALAVMDAKHLAFPDTAFDAVVAQYVITAVPDPEATLDEFARVLKPGGEIVLVNHIGAEAGLWRAFETWFSPMARKLGWRPEFPWARLVRWAARVGSGPQGVHLVERRPMPLLRQFSLVRFAKATAAARASAEGSARASRASN